MVLEKLLDLQIEDEEKYWIVFNWLKHEFFVLIKKKVTDIDWYGNFPKSLETVYADVISKWKQTEGIILQHDSNFPVKRLNGILYEVLFYLNCIETSSMHKFCRIMELAGDPISDEKSPWFVVIPIYDILPKTFRIKENDKWVFKSPQIEADFIVCYWDEKRGSLPLSFIDVKTNLKNYNKQKRSGYALGCKYFYNSSLQIARPKIKYPKNLNEWNIEYVCWNCGSLNKDIIYCQDCGTKIWVTKEEVWNTYPLKQKSK